jgi:hypothetical protein
MMQALNSGESMRKFSWLVEANHKDVTYSLRKSGPLYEPSSKFLALETHLDAKLEVIPLRSF